MHPFEDNCIIQNAQPFAVHHLGEPPRPAGCLRKIDFANPVEWDRVLACLGCADAQLILFHDFDGLLYYVASLADEDALPSLNLYIPLRGRIQYVANFVFGSPNKSTS